VSEVGASEAVRLFVVRVRAHLPDFMFGERNAPTIVEICRRLDGLPLALELVAARVEGLGLAEVAARLGDRFALAVRASRGAPARQRTLQAALEWSYSLLDADERMMLRRLAVFVGGWTLEAAQAVCGDDSLSAELILEVLERLVAKSLVVADHHGTGVRYRQLETVRAYALAQLAAAGETAALQERHAAFVLRLAERAPPESANAAQAALLTPEEDNVRAALAWAVQHEQAELGLRLASAAFPLWWFTGHYVEGHAWFDRLLALPAAEPGARSTALSVDGQLLTMLGEYALAQQQLEAALEECQSRGDARGIGLIHLVLGNVAMLRGDLKRAVALHTEATQRLRAAGSPGDVVSLAQLALAALELAGADRARQLIAELEGIGHARQEPVVLSRALHLRAVVAASEGAVATATSLIEQALALVRPSANQQLIVIELTSLGHIRIDQGQPAAALAAFAESIKLARASGERVRLIHALEGCARCLAASDPDAAVRLAGATAAQRRSLGVEPWPSERRYLDGWLAVARRTLGPSAYQRAWDDGRASTLDQAVSLAEALLVVPPAAAAPTEVLSPREQEVAVLLAQGLTNKQIASELVVSPATVRSHVEHILDKLDLRSRAQVATWASQHGLLPPTASR
ncbi:MAG: hypothetical protein JO023_00055, partial [Chloroflexi bacterium]|nr:hypothetical protein [Chloroflexota bacterium]